MVTPSYKLALKAGHFFMAHLVLAPPLMFVTKHQGPPLWQLNQSPHPGSLILTTPTPPGGRSRTVTCQSVSSFPCWFGLGFSLGAVGLEAWKLYYEIITMGYGGFFYFHSATLPSPLSD